MKHNQFYTIFTSIIDLFTLIGLIHIYGLMPAIKGKLLKRIGKEFIVVKTYCMKGFVCIIAIIAIASCNSIDKEPESEYRMASPKYAEIAEQATDYFSKLDFQAWGKMLADDVEFYFPNGTPDTRTKLIGKTEVLDWWENWKSQSGVKSLTMSDRNYIPVQTQTVQRMTGLDGAYVFSWITTEMEFENEQTASVRMHIDMHINASNKIDRFFSYYDRTPIIDAMGMDYLKLYVK